MFLEMQHPDGGMRPLPPEEGEGEAHLRFPEGKNRRPTSQRGDSRRRPDKNRHSKVKHHNVDIRHLTKRIENFAESEISSDNDALKLIEDTRGTILKLRLIKKNKKNKSSGRHNSPHTSKKLPPKYGQH